MCDRNGIVLVHRSISDIVDKIRGTRTNPRNPRGVEAVRALQGLIIATGLLYGIAASYSDGSTIVRSVGTEKELLTLTGHESAVYALAWSPDGKRLATGSLDHTARVWDAASGAELLSMPNQSDNVLGVAWSPDSKRLAIASGDHAVRVYAMDIHDLMLARRRVTRELRQEECHTYLHMAKCPPTPSTLD
jgi:WD40 repeat protein